MPRVHFLSAPSSFRELLPRQGRPEPLQRLRCCPEGGQCQDCNFCTTSHGMHVSQRERGLTANLLCDRSIRTGCQGGAWGVFSGGDILSMFAPAYRAGSNWTCAFLSLPRVRSDSCPQVRLRMTYKACTRRFLDHSRHTESKWPRQSDGYPILTRARFSKVIRSWSLLRFSAVVMGAMAPMLQSLQRSPLSTW